MSRSRRSRITGFATRSTSRIRICRRCTPRSRGSSPGTITKPRTTTPGSSRRIRPTRPTTRPTSRRGGRAPTRRTTSTCRCAPRSSRSGPYLQLYRRLQFGEMLSVNMLDTRQYRSHRAPASCLTTERVDGYCPSALDPTRTIEGTAQQAWLIDGLDRSTARVEPARQPGALRTQRHQCRSRDPHARRREVGRLSGGSPGRARFHQQPRADQHRGHHRRRPSELRPERAAGLRAARRRAGRHRVHRHVDHRAAATAHSPPSSAATPTTRTCASRTTIMVTSGAQSPPICGAPITAWCHRSRYPTMAALERSRRLWSSRHDQGRKQRRAPVHHKHCQGGGNIVPPPLFLQPSL